MAEALLDLAQEVRCSSSYEQMCDKARDLRIRMSYVSAIIARDVSVKEARVPLSLSASF